METIGFLFGIGWFVAGLFGSHAMISKGYRMSAHSFLWGAMLGPLQIALAAALPDQSARGGVTQQYPPLTSPVTSTPATDPKSAVAPGFRDFPLFCPHCDCSTTHKVRTTPAGIQVKFVLSDTLLIGGKKYWLACSNCANVTKELSRQQADALRDGP